MSCYLSICEVNIKCMKDYNKNKELSYLNYCDVNSLYGWAMSLKLPVLSRLKINLSLIKVL